MILKIFLNLVIAWVVAIVGLLAYRHVYRMKQLKSLKIISVNGIDESRVVELNGIKHFIYIRGENLSNPMILFLHGGPGSPMTPLIYKYQVGLEQDYTVVNWEQRNTGKTYFLNKSEELKIKETLCIAQYIDDIYELVMYLKQEFHQEVVIMGHSWGSTIGAMFVQRYPDLVRAYVGIGQNLSINAGEQFIAEVAPSKMTKKDQRAYSKLMIDKKRIQFDQDEFDVKVFVKHRKLSGKYLMPDVVTEGELVKMTLLSPTYSLKDIRWFLMNNLKLQQPLLTELASLDLRNRMLEYQVPMIFVMGDADWITPYPLVEQYYKEIHAPNKELIFIKNAGHSPMIDQPELFCSHVLEALNSL